MSSVMKSEDLVASNFNAISAEPLVEVCSVTINPYDPANPLYKVHGLIYVEDGKGKSNYLYYRGPSNPETITPENGKNSLTLTGPYRNAISMAAPVRLIIELVFVAEVNKSQSFLIYDKVLLDVDNDSCYEETKSVTLEGNLGVVCVNYIVVPCGAIAQVEVVFSNGGVEALTDAEYSTDRSGRHDADICGSIIACYGKTYGHIQRDSTPPKAYPSSILYRSPANEWDEVAFGEHFELCRSLVCVPSYSTLSVELNMTLKDCDAREPVVISFSRDFNPFYYDNKDNKNVALFPDKEYCCVGNVGVLVKVQWGCSDYQYFVEDLHKEALEKEKRHKYPQLPPTVAATGATACRSFLPDLRLRRTGRIDVISVFVGHEGKERVDLTGTTAVNCLEGNFYIFRRDENKPDSLSPQNKATSLEGLTSYEGDWMSVYLKLKDIKGYVDIDSCLARSYHTYIVKRDWYNRPLCSVLLGSHGFAAVHYIVCDVGFRADVEIYVTFKEDNVVAVQDSISFPLVYGTVVAQYGNYQYLSSYERKYCRTLLFEELQENNARPVTQDDELPLSRNVISVPMGKSLVIDVDLHATGRLSSEVCAEHLKDYVEFEIGDDECKKIVGQYFEVEVFADWEEM